MKTKGLYAPEFETANCGAGFICSLKGLRSNKIIYDALEILIKLEHRGAVSADGKTGDGAGILIDIPHDFFVKQLPFPLPPPHSYAVAMTFFPKEENQFSYCKNIFEKQLLRQGLSVLGWREVPVDRTHLGKMAAKNEPKICQLFIGKGKEGEGEEISDFEFKIKLFIARKITEHKIQHSKLYQRNKFYVVSLSTTTLIYKGLIKPVDISRYYIDLTDTDLVTRLALVHQRFSTNTFPSWDLAQPFRYICHNGEINTLRGNINRMSIREELMDSPFFKDSMQDIFPIILKSVSDSASMDMVVELLLLTKRSLPEVMMMLVPEAWEKDTTMGSKKRAFYEYNACIMESWDGPASIPFTDGDCIGALLDRNGLRPSRYTVTKDGYVVMSSETGVLDIPPEKVLRHGRVQPGKIFLVDMEMGKIIEDAEIKNKIIHQHPYEKWVEENLLPLIKVPYTRNTLPIESTPLLIRQKIFGYTIEEINHVILPMAVMGKEPLGSMGYDAPLAVLSKKPQLLYNYFKQLFAQVTNPPLDGIREEVVTDTSLLLGAYENIFDIHARHAKKLKIQNPIISNEDLEKIKTISHPDFQSQVIPTLYEIERGVNGMEEALDKMVENTLEAVSKGSNIIILSDRNIDKKRAPLPMLLACSYLDHCLIKHKKRSRFGIVIESAEPREPHHFATLFGYGASAINPYMVNEIIEEKVAEKELQNLDAYQAIRNYNKAISQGVLKIMNKIGISTLHSYRCSQIFEILGLNSAFCKKYFPNTPSRIEGIGLYEIEKDVANRYKNSFTRDENNKLTLNIGGDYRWRRNAELHMFHPLTVSKLQQAVRLNHVKSYQKYAHFINQQEKHLMTLRGLLHFDNLNPIDKDQVEPWTEIVKRFKTGAMSYGSLSSEAHENLAIAMNRIHAKSNSGEGGESKERFQKDLNGDMRNSKIKQVASGRFGVSSHYLTHAVEIQIKMAQGAKPGEGGQLPSEKVFPWIAKVRNSTPYVGLISPPPHHDIYSIEDLAQLIYDLKSANRTARINVKLVSKVGVGTIAAGVAKAKADVILISGYDGGTGASPLTSIRHAGLPWELGIAEVQQTLVLNNLRNRIVLECDGQLKTGRDVAIAALLGAEEFGFSTAPLVASGCIMMRKCHLNTCPVGIATQDPELRKNFKGTPEHVINFMYFVAEELRSIMAKLGFHTINEMVGRVDKLSIKKNTSYKASGIDLSPLLYKPKTSNPVYHTQKQEHGLENALDFLIFKKVQPSIYRKQKMVLHLPIKNTDRAVGAILSNELSKIYADTGLEEDSLQIFFTGTAGQSFGAFTIKGVTFHLEGNANDYVGKGLSGGKLILKTPKSATFIPQENIIAGNVILYGATGGEVFINGVVGERFCVRNSGAIAVVEGVGDHCCEYMTGGKVLILGKTGRNFAAGMSGGIAYVLDKDRKLQKGLCNIEMVELEPLDEKDENEVYELIQKHVYHTHSPLAKSILNEWEKFSADFIKVMPTDYKKAMERLKKEELHTKKISYYE